MGHCRFIVTLVDVVYIGLINSMHKSTVTEALNSGKHVLCEKPLGLNVSQTEEMIETAKRNRRFLMEGFWSRCFPAYSELKKQISQGAIGEPKLITASFGYPHWVASILSFTYILLQN